MQANAADAEPDVAAGSQPGGDEILHDLLLPVAGDPLPGQVRQVEPDRVLAEPQVQPVVRQALGVQPLRHSALAQRLHRAVLEHARAYPALHVNPVPPLQHHRLGDGVLQHIGAGFTGSFRSGGLRPFRSASGC